MFREFGIPARIEKVTDIDRLAELRTEHSGSNNCYVSVYAFRDEKGSKTDYNSAVVSTIWFDFDENKDVSRCLKDVRKLYNRFCVPRNIIPRIFYTGGRGFQLNIDFPEPLEIPNGMKRESIRDYLLYLKKEYVLSTLDVQCINNSVSCMRRMSNTPYLDKKTKEPTGRYCIQLEIEEMLEYDMNEIISLSMYPRVRIFEYPGEHNIQASKEFLFFICDKIEVPYTPTNSIPYLLTQIHKAGKFDNGYDENIGTVNYLPVRECIYKLIEESIKHGHCGHSENTAIAAELVSAGWKDTNIGFVFQSIFNEEGGDKYGWYNDDGTAGYQIKNIREKAINRYSRDRLVQLKICKNKYCGCGG